MATVCYTRATLTSARVITSYSVITSSRNVVSTSPGRTSVYLYSSTSCAVISSRAVCSTYRSTRISVLLPQVYTSVVRYYTSIPVYITSRVTLYSTSCSVSRPTPSSPPRPTTPPRPVTTYFTTTRTTPIAITTTRTTGVPVPVTTTRTTEIPVAVTTTETLGVTDRLTTTEISGFTVSTTATETVSQGTDAPLPQGGGTTGLRNAPVGAIVGGVLGGLVAASILGFLVYYMCFRKTKRYRPEDSRNLDHQRSISPSALDGQSSPSEGSSAFMPHNGARQANLDGSQGQMQDGMQDGALHAPLDGGQPMQYQAASQDSHNMNARAGHRYSHLRQDSLGGHAIAVPMRPLSATTEQGYYYPQPTTGQYLGHAEVQDSRW